MHAAQTQRVSDLDSTWPQRGGDSGAGERPAGFAADWPGRGYGVRGPAYPGETTLSWQEVEVALKGIYQ